MMKRAFGLAVFAVLAMGLATAGAQAQEHTFKSAGANPHITGSQIVTHVFSIVTTFEEVHSLECGTATFASKPDPAGTSTESLMIDPTYKECEFAGLPATVDVATDSCSFEFYATTGADLSCATDGKVRISIFLDSTHTVKLCELRVYPSLDTSSTGVGATRTQGKFAGVTYANNGGHVDVTTAITGIRWQTVGDLCPSPEETENTGEYTGKTTLKGNQGAIEVT